jgi:DNA-binding response OmpR family regulator
MARWLIHKKISNYVMAKILIVNNDIDTMTLLKKWLQRRNHEVTYTGNGEEVPHLVNNFAPDLVLVDILQSKVVEQLKSDNQSKQIPVILMTGYTLSKQPLKTDIVDDVIEKPFNPKVLEKKIENVLKKTG